MSDNPFEASGGPAPSTSEQELRIEPSTQVGTVLQESFRLWLAVLPIVALTVVLATVPSSLISTAVSYSPLDLTTQMRIQQLVDGLFTMVQVGAIGTVLYRASLDQETSMGAALTGGIALFIPLVILNIPVGLATVCGLVLLIVPGVYLGTRLSMTHVAYMMEPGDGIGSALSRSWKLTEGRFGPTFLVCVASVLSSVAVLVVYMLAAFGWGFIIGILIETGAVDGASTLVMVLDYIVLLAMDLLAAYPFLFSWFPIFVYFVGVRDQVDEDWAA